MKSRSRLFRFFGVPAVLLTLVGTMFVATPASSLIIAARSVGPSVPPTIVLQDQLGVVRVSSDYWKSAALGPAPEVTFDVDRIQVDWFSCSSEDLNPIADDFRIPDGCGASAVSSAAPGNAAKMGTLGTWDYSYDLQTQTFIRARLHIPADQFVGSFASDYYWTPTVELAPAQNPNQTPSPDPYQSPPPYEGPVIGYIDYQPPKPEDTDKPYDDKPRPGGELIMQGPGTEDIEEASIDEKPAEVRREGERTIITIPEDIEPGVKDIVLEGPFGELTLQDAIEIYPPLEDEDIPANFTRAKPSECTPRDTEFSAWTQDQLDGTVLFFAKNVVGAGEISFQQNRKDLLTHTAVSEDDPRIRWGNCSPYFLHRFTREEVKNGLEVYQDGVRVWRAAYSGTGIK